MPEPGGSNKGKYEKGPFCGPAGGAPEGTFPVNTKARAIAAIAYSRNAPNPDGIKACVCKKFSDLPACNEKKKMTFSDRVDQVPSGAMWFVDKECFAKVEKPKEDGDETLMMVGYSGGVIKNHWFWGDLVIDLDGMSFDKGVYPILEQHDIERKIAFADEIEIDSGALVIRNAKFVDTPESLKFRKLASEGFPFESSIYARPTVISEIKGGESRVVNGMEVSGPAKVWDASTFMEASVVVFGADSNTVSGTMAEMSYKVATLSDDESEHIQREEEGGADMDLEKFKAEYGELYSSIVESVRKEAEDKFAVERDGLKERVRDLEKEIEISREKEIRFHANEIWSAKLAESDIPERLHGKVVEHVQYNKFVKDGALDVAAFSDAVVGEIKTWQDLGVSSKVIGGGLLMKGVEDDATKLKRKESEENQEVVNRLLGFVGGR